VLDQSEMNKDLLPRAIEFTSVLLSKALEVLQKVPRGLRWRTLGTYLRIKTKSGWFAVLQRGQPDRESIFDWDVSIGNYSDFVFLFEEIFIAECYRTPIAKRAPIIIDAGANIGLATLYFKRNFPDAFISCIEPEPNAYARLEDNVRRNKLTRVVLYNKALGRRPGILDFRWSSSRLASPIAGRDSAVSESTAVEVIPLSSLVKGPIDLLKLDVEGAETEVIKDLVETRGIGQIGILLLEYHHHVQRDDDNLSEVLALLESAGFGYQIAHVGKGSPRDYQDVMLYSYPVGERVSS
jgi:FkbM family methyltransferase